MKNFAMVVYAGLEAGKASGGARFMRWKEKLPGIFRRERVDGWVVRAVFHEDLEAFIIKIPHSADTLKEIRKSSLVKKIAGYCDRSGIETCFFPEGLKGLKPGEENARNALHLQTRLLFHSLLANIMEEISLKKGVPAGGPDIVMIPGESRKDLFAAIRLLADTAKYITVVSNEQDKIREELGNIFDDSGLAIGVTSDWRNGLKNADVVINFAGARTIPGNLKLKNGSFFINLGDEDIRLVPDGCTVINGVEIRLPESMMMKLGKEVLQCFEMNEIAAIILGTRFNSGNEEHMAVSAETVKRKISYAFAKEGYRIIGFKGRHSMIRIS